MTVAESFGQYDWSLPTIAAPVVIYLILAALTHSWKLTPNEERDRRRWRRKHPEETDDDYER